MSAIRLIVPTLAVTALVAACGKAEPPAPVSALAKAPEFASCQWQTTKGATASIGAFACGPDHRNLHLVADDALPGFVLVQDGPDGPVRTTAIRLFGKAPGSPLAGALSSVKAVSRGPLTRTCAFEPAVGADHAGKNHFVLTPVGEEKIAWEKSIKGDAPAIAEPCGPWGVGIAGDRYFYEAPGHPDTVVAVDAGSEIQIFDPATLVLTPAK